MVTVRKTFVDYKPPISEDYIWIDISGESPVQKVFINGNWEPTSVGTDDFYTKEESDETFMKLAENVPTGNILAAGSDGQATNTGKKINELLDAPATPGVDGQVLSLQPSGPAWVNAPQGTVIVDGEMSDISENPVQNKVIKSYVDGNYARKDGYYSQMTVGSAENLVGETVDSEAYLIRPTGGESNEVANSVASVIGMEGHTEKFNQLVKNGNFNGNTSYWSTMQTSTVQVQNNVLFMSWTSQYANNGIYQLVAYVVGHKYYICGTIKNTADIQSTYYLGQPYGAQVSASLGVGEKRVISGIRTINTATGNGYVTFNLFGLANFGNSVEATNIMLIDLTAIFGAGNEPTTVAEFEAWLAKNVGLKPYYAYNAGTLLSAQTLGIKTYGQNLLNPTTRQAKLIPYEWEENSNVYTIKNVPSGATATFTPDATGVAVTVDISGGSLDITSYGSGILELSAATAETYVCMKWDEQKDDDVVPFEEHTQNFDVRKVYGKVSGAGEYVQCYPNGLRGIGDIKDTLNANEAVVKIGIVDLGDLTWDKSDSHPYYPERNAYYSTVQGIFIPSSNSQRRNGILSAKFSTPSGTGNIDLSYGGNSLKENNQMATAVGKIFIRCDEYNYTDSFKTAMSGVKLIYELATPITYTDLIYRDGGIDTPLADALLNITVNNWSIEEQLLTPYDNGNPTAVPAKISTQYGMDAVEEIDTIKHTYVSAYTEQNFSDSQKAQARRNIGAVEEDGTYPNMSVGIAKNLAGENAVEAEYTYRRSNGTIGTATGIANLTAVKGKTLKWNQQINTNWYLSNFPEGVTVSSDGVISVPLGYQSGSFNIINSEVLALVIGHKYCLSGNYQNSPELYLRCPGSNAGSPNAKGVVFSATSTEFRFNIYSVSETTYEHKFKPQLFDLTDLFGAGNEPSTAAEFEALYPLDYYAYTATPVLINNAASGIVTTGFNQWDEQWENKNIENSTGAKTSDPTRICSKNFIPAFPSTNYFIHADASTANIYFYDADYNYISYVTLYPQSDGSFTTPSNTYYLQFKLNSTYGTTYKNDVCINLSDAAKNGTYEPYEKHTFYFDKVLQSEGSLATIKGKLNGEGESVVVFPEGLKKAGSVYDEIKGNVAIKRIGSRAYASGDESDSTVLTDGTITYYVLATPETYTLDQTVTGGYQVNALGTEKRLPEDTASAVNAPVSYSVIYPIDAVGTITKLPINYISEGSLTNFTTELASKLGTFLNATIGISATYNQTTQEYDYAITIVSNE